MYKNSRLEVFCKKRGPQNTADSQERTCIEAFFEKETPTQVFYCKFYEIFESSFFLRYHR